MTVRKLIKRVRRANHQRAVSALDLLEERISPQGAAFMEEAVTAIPMLFEAAAHRKTSIRVETLSYLGHAYADTLGTWQFRWDEDPATRHHFTEMVAWEHSIAASYRAGIGKVAPFLRPGNDEAVRGSAAYLLSRIKESGPELIATLQGMYDEPVSASLKIDIIEGVANLAITLHRGSPCDLEWLHAKLDDASPAVRLGAALSLLAREGDDRRQALTLIARDARVDGESALRQAAWLSGKATEWAFERRLRYIDAPGGELA